MKWEEVRNIYPNKFVLLRSLESHIEENKKCIDDVAVVRVLDDEDGYINGLLGLDVLLKLGITINLKELKLYRS